MAGCVGCVGLGWRWRIPGTQLRERGNILRWCLTGMQGAEHKEMWWNRGRKWSWVWNWVRKGWLLSRVQKVLAPGSWTGGKTHPPPGVSEDQPCPQQVAQVGIAGMTLPSASSSASLSPALYPHSPGPAQRKGCSSAPTSWKNCQKSPSNQVHPHWERLDTISAQPRPLLPSRVGKLWPETRNQETSPPACFSSPFGEQQRIIFVSKPLQRQQSSRAL